MKKILFSIALVSLLSSASWAGLFDFPTGLEMKADERAREIMSIPGMQARADKQIADYVSKPENLMVIEHNTRSFEKMGDAEIANHITAPELIEQETQNPITETDFGEDNMFIRSVGGILMVNEALFQQGDVNHYFSNEEIVKIKKILQEEAYRKTLNSLSMDGMFFGYPY